MTNTAPTLPARYVPLLYLAFAHLCLIAAFGTLGATPRTLGGFFYHPRLVAVVHLVTLGWISGSILGAVYIVGPLAFRMPLPARARDYAAFGAFAIGVSGMVSHFWLDSPSGMAWSAALVLAAIGHVAARALRGLRTAPVPLEARLPMALAFLNVLLAAGLGLLLAANKVSPFLGVSHLDAVYAHAHLAALGFATMMVVGAGYRMLPMVLPAAMPRGFWAYAASVLLEAGALGLTAAFLAGRGHGAAALVTVAGIACFLSRVVFMLRNRRPAPRELKRPDWGVAHAFQSLLCLLLACALGLYLAFAEPSDATLALVPAYGTFALVGFLAQIVVGIEGRLLPLFGWLWGFADRSHAEAPPSLHSVPARPLQALGFGLWSLSVPLLAYGLAAGRPAAVSLSGGLLLLAVLANLANVGLILVRLWRR